MRPIALIAALALVAPLAAGDAPAAPAEPPPAASKVAGLDPAALRTKVSYLVGLHMKKQLDRSIDMAVDDGQLDRAELTRGFQEAQAGKAVEPTQEETQALFERYQEQLQAAKAKAGEAGNADNAAFLAENGKKPGVTTTASGLQYEVVKAGPKDGKQPKATSNVRVNYKGTKRDGTVFDASEKHGGPAEFPLNGVIKGWTEGVQLMREGDTFRFTIPSELAYGASGPPSIGANQVLIFEVELLAVLSDAK